MARTQTSEKTNLQPVAGPFCWRGEELRGTDDWIRRFAATEIAELEDAVRRSKHTPIADISPSRFPLPTLGPALAALRGELIDGRGFVLLRGLPVDRWTREETARVYWGLGLHLGQPVSQNPEGHLLGHVKDIGGEFDDLNSRGGYRSRAHLPFHTDVGADVVGLLCLRRAETGGESSLASVAAVYNAMLEQRPDLARLLARPIYRDRRGEIPPGKKPFYKAPVFCLHEGRLTTTFVRRFIDSAPRHDGVPEPDPALPEALDLFESLADALRFDMDFQVGDIQLVNNLTLLHARARYVDTRSAAEKRHLLRLWLAVPEGWPLPDHYFDRFGTQPGTGRPGGMAMPGVTPSVPLDAA